MSLTRCPASLELHLEKSIEYSEETKNCITAIFRYRKDDADIIGTIKEVSTHVHRYLGLAATFDATSCNESSLLSTDPYSAKFGASGIFVPVDSRT